MKLERHGQAEPILELAYLKIRDAFLEESHKAILDVAYHTGERWGAILQLQVADVYVVPMPSNNTLQTNITFRASTRKDRSTRQVPIHPGLQRRLQAYAPPADGWLFPSSINDGGHLTLRAADRALRRALQRAKLENQGYSSHSTRRGFITSLHNKGVPIRVIQKLTGHKSLSVLSQYVDVSEDQCRAALGLL